MERTQQGTKMGKKLKFGGLKFTEEAKAIVPDEDDFGENVQKRSPDEREHFRFTESSMNFYKHDAPCDQ